MSEARTRSAVLEAWRGMQPALVEASRRCFGDDDHSDGASARREQVARAGRWQQVRAFSVLIERFAPVPDVFEEVERQVFARCSGPLLLKDTVEADDWSTLAGLWDPAADGYLFRRPDVHIIRSLHVLTAQLPS